MEADRSLTSDMKNSTDLLPSETDEDYQKS